MAVKFKSDIITSIDVGSSKIICLIAKVEDNNMVKIIGIGHQLSQGIKGTVITDINLAESSIISAVYEAEKMANVNIERVTLSISGAAIMEKNIEASMEINDYITTKNVRDLTNKALSSFDVKNYTILHQFPLEFGLDDNFGINMPIGMYGYKLFLKLKVIYLPSTHMINFLNCLQKCRLEVDQVIISGYASSFALLTKEEAEEGVTLIEIGASTTSVNLFYQNKIFATYNIPFGGNHITSDISYALAIDKIVAERIKIIHGNAFVTSFDEGNMIEIPNDVEESCIYISRAELSMIIRARLEEILELAKEKVENTPGLTSKKIVLTGGTSNLVGAKEVASTIFNRAVRVACPKELKDMENFFHNRADFSAAVGAIHYTVTSQSNLPPKRRFFEITANPYFNKLVKWFKEHL